jgi:hypothetical protein
MIKNEFEKQIYLILLLAVPRWKARRRQPVDQLLGPGRTPRPVDQKKAVGQKYDLK